MESLGNTTFSAAAFDVMPNSPLLYMKERLWALRVLCPVSLLIIIFGLVSNTLNLIVFYKAGVKDNVSTLLFSLAMSDSIYLCLASPNACFWVIWVFTSTRQTLFSSILDYDKAVGDYVWPFHFQFVNALFYWPAYTAFDLSCFISLSLGVMRCACIAMPLKFKLVFTRSRTVKWVLFLVVLAVCLRIPVLSIFRVTWKSDPLGNTTYLYVSIAKNSAFMNRINDIMNRSVVILITYSVMVGSVFLLTFKLYQASKVRRSCTNQVQAKYDQGMSTKDIQVIKSVVLVCIIFIFSQLPLLVMSQIRLFDPQFNDFGRLEGLLGTTARLSFTCSILNASINIFVYYNYNSKYRAVFLALFRLSKEEKI